MTMSGMLGALPELLNPKFYVFWFVVPALLKSLWLDQKHSPDTKTTFQPEYDFIIIGAGSAGATVAGRLSEVGCVSTLLLEAGGKPILFNEIPAFARNFWDTDLDWQFKTTPQKHTGHALEERRVTWPSGKAIGGSSVINALLYVRGNRRDYDDWAAGGATGWSYNEVLPYFRKLEDNRNYNDAYHARGGPVTFEKPRYDESDLKRAIIEFTNEMGYRYGDNNGPNQTGFTDIQANIRNGQRCSTAKAYLVPAENRPNLDILPYSYVRKIIIENGKAVGVQFDYNGITWVVRARKEVILSAGATNSAQILMLSGIGPAQHLQEKNIPVIVDLPVGNNLQDHCSAVMNYVFPEGYSNVYNKLLDPKAAWQYTRYRTGPFSAPEMISGMAFLQGLNLHPMEDWPNYQLYFAEATSYLPAKKQFGLTSKAYDQVYRPYENRALIVCLSQVLHPKSRGTVRLNSNNPYDPPLIDPNYFENPEDLEDVIQGMKMCELVGTSNAFKRMGVKPIETLYPGCEQFAGNDDNYLACQARGAVVTMSHQVGTAKMGDPGDITTVVDPQLRVKNIQGLRVVDASVMPIVPSGNTNVPTIMVAEKASDMIKMEIRCFK